ncbi:hypothetical protein [Acetobacter sp.]|uniref:hypothetical protein n=1 Tax=Acetobacter sp. TaxID=440 RepID=UPI0025B8F8A3|nr:hypothetical protein [Acetobacter sp.]MCH4092680.1 hypothetical protein [Acetobacter sp.]MCI1301218.1 hypothetical protein [Acetobacter sp.]MCI1317479.1 hypothetical protein [Acetobacter sp.]
MKDFPEAHEADLQADRDFLIRWRQSSARDTAIMLRASLLRRTNPELVKAVETQADTSLSPVD